MKKTVFIVLALALIACATAVIGQAPAGPPPMAPGVKGGVSCPAMALAPPPAMVFERADALQLTDDQKTKLKDSLAKGEETLQPLRQKAMEATRALREALFAASFDAAKVSELAASAEKADAAIVKAEVETWTQIRSILTADQVTKLQELMGRRMGQGHNRNRGGGGAAPGAPPLPGL